MHRVAFVLSFVVIAAVATGCRAVTPRPDSPTAPPSSEPSVDVEALTSTAWRLVELAGEVVDRSLERSIAFGSDGSVAGNGGCNRFGGSATIGPGTLVVGELVTTDAACADPVAHGLEQRFLELLDGATGWRIDPDPDRALVIDGPAGRLTFAEA